MKGNEHNKKPYDVAIIGAGPAGLSLAKELGRRHSVLIVEKGKIAETNKAWGVLENNGFRVSDDIVLNRFTSFTVRVWDHDQHYDFSTQTTNGDACALIDEKKVLESWARSAAARCRIFQKTTYLDFGYLGESVRVRTTAGIFMTRLLVDATGYDSPIKRQIGIDGKTDFFVPVYGGYIRNACHEDTDRAFGLIMHPDVDIFTEYFPISKQTGCAWAFKFLPPSVFRNKPEQQWIEELEDGFMTLLRREPELGQADITLKRYGIVPVKQGRRLAKNRILFIGDAGVSTPYSMLGFNAIYKNHMDVADQISERVTSDRLDARSLSRIVFNQGHRFSEIAAPLFIRTATKLSAADVLSINDKLKAGNLFDQFCKVQAHAVDNSLQLSHIVLLLKEIRRLPWMEMIDTVRALLKFLSIFDIGRLIYAALSTTFIKQRVHHKNRM